MAGGRASPATAVRLIAHIRFSSAFCDYVLQNEPERIVEISTLDVLRATAERQREVEEWLKDWEVLPESEAKRQARRQLILPIALGWICLRHLWIASQALSGERRMFLG
jgi:hypothetical protein